MHEDVVSLLKLQAEDGSLQDLEQRRAATVAREEALDRQRQFAADALARARHAVEQEERRQRELSAKISGHKQLHDKNLARFDAVRKMRDANAAMAQAELTRKVLADEESELQTMNRRIGDLRQAADAQASAVADVEREQADARAELGRERATLDAELAGARAKRERTAEVVARPLLSRYERIRARRQSEALYALRGPSCGNCDTAIPLQRRHQMQASGAIEVCEGCGVLLYAPQ